VNKRFLYMNGRMVPYGDAMVHVHSNAVKYGTSVFEGLRAYWSPVDEELYVFRLDAHCRRLLQSLKLMRMEHAFDVGALQESVLSTLKTNSFREDVHIRQTAYLSAEDANVEAAGPTGLAVDARPLRMSSKPALDVCVSTWVRNADGAMPPRIKSSANYQNSRLAMLEARGDGYDCALLLNSRGKVAEAPGAAFFIVRDGVPITPPVTADILESITRATLIQLFRDCHGLSVLERDIDRTEVYIAEEAFLCGTGWEVSPIGSIDRLPLGAPAPGAITLAIASTYFRAVRGELSAYRYWLTPVYRRS
jgi:branched-chain amino acid aminotransferase